MPRTSTEGSCLIQLNEYETAPYFVQFSQNLTCNCQLISVYPPNLAELNLKLFCSDVQNNFRFSLGNFWGKCRNQQTTTCQVLAELNEIWSYLIFIKLYELWFGGKVALARCFGQFLHKKCKSLIENIHMVSTLVWENFCTPLTLVSSTIADF